MITIEQARDRVNDRMERLDTDTDETAPIEAIALLCSGTDIIGPQLQQELSRSTQETLRLMESTRCECDDGDPPVFNCTSSWVVAGLLNRTFWLGFELGRHADD